MATPVIAVRSDSHLNEITRGGGRVSATLLLLLLHLHRARDRRRGRPRTERDDRRENGWRLKRERGEKGRDEKDNREKKRKGFAAWKQIKRTRKKWSNERKGWKEAGGEKVLVAWLQGVEGRRKGTVPKAKNKRGRAADMSVIKTMELHRRGLLF